MNFLNKLLIKLFCQKVGFDEFGNEYFINKKGKRFIAYKGIAEASKIPAKWHGWIHYTTNSLPTDSNIKEYPWQKIHLPNLTGTKNAYAPNNSTNIKPEYEAWNPNK